jgi:hypothetical protein
MENPIPQDISKAKEAIEAVLAEHKVALIPIVVHQGDRTFSSIDIVPIDQLNKVNES